MKRGQIERLAQQIMDAAERGDLLPFGVSYDPQRDALVYTEFVTEFDDPTEMGAYSVVEAPRAETFKRLCAMIYSDGAEMFIVVGDQPVFLVKLLRGRPS